MSIDLESPNEQDTPSAGLSDLLSRLVAKREVRDGIAKQLKQADEELESLESLAAEQLGASGLDGCRVAGKTWWIDEALYISTVSADREKLLAAAKAEGLEDAITVSTTTIKAWLTERAKNSGSNLENATAGTKFDGLVSEYVKVRLRSRTTG